jgi:uncharacterized protein YbjT (DUF2867 family)
VKVLVTGGAGFIGSHLVDASVLDEDALSAAIDGVDGTLTVLEAARRAGVELGFECRVPFEEGLRRTVDASDPARR